MKRAHVVVAIERDRGPEIEPGAMGEEIRRRRPRARARRQVAQPSTPTWWSSPSPIDIGARFDQQRYDAEIRRVGRKVQGIGVVAVVADANVRAAIEQQPHAVRRLRHAAMCSAVRPRELPPRRVDQIEMLIEQPAKLVGAALLRGVEDGADRALHAVGTIVARLVVAGEQLDRVWPPALADLVDGAAVVVGDAGIESALESTANGFDIAGARRGEHALAMCSSTGALSARQLAKP